MPPSLRALILSVLVAAASLALAQPPPTPPPPSGDGSLPPLKQKQLADGERDADRDGPARPRRGGAPLPMMNGVEMPEMESAIEEPVTASGNIDLWQARIAERRASQESTAASGGGAPR